MITIDDLKKNVKDLPPLPDVVMRLIQMSHDESVAPRDLVQLVKHDSAITMKVLKLCNSTFYGLPRKVTSLHEAMIYIGSDALVSLVLSGCIASFYQKSNEGYGLLESEMWRHAVGSAICSQIVAGHCAKEVLGVAFTAGLLHDIGKILLNSYVAAEFQTVIDLVEREGDSFVSAEMKVLGLTHPVAGAEIAEFWNLPSELVEAIRYHHEPSKATDFKKLIAAVHVGDIMCISFGVGVGADGLAYNFDPEALAVLNLDQSDLDTLSIDFHDQLKSAQELLEIS
jgi:putative nucleotidyltransferase with HDIG domain